MPTAARRAVDAAQPQVLTHRVVGLETEHAIRVHGEVADPAAVAAAVALEALGRTTHPTGYAGHLPNGARAYLDLGTHPELATFEHPDVDLVVACDTDGSAAIAERIAAAAARSALPGVTGLSLLRGNVDTAGSTWGSHENLQLSAHLDPADVARRIGSHLVTRIRWAGAGTILHHGGDARTDEDGQPVEDPDAAFVLSSRAAHLLRSPRYRHGHVAADATTRDRPLVSLRPEHHADHRRFRRLHVICGDSSVGHEPAAVRLASTALLLTALEIDRTALDPWLLLHPRAALLRTSADVAGTALVRLADGRRVRPGDVQDGLLETAAATIAAGGEMDERQRGWLARWQALVDLVRTTPDDASIARAATAVDWAAKHRLLDAWRTRHDASWADRRLRHLDIAYHAVGEGWGTKLAAAGRGPRLSTDELRAAAAAGPVDGRAAARGRVVAWLRAHRMPAAVDWAQVLVSHGGDPIRLAMPDPAGVDPGAVEAFLQRLADAARDRPSWDVAARPVRAA